MLDLSVTAILRRVPEKSGVTEPYICKCDDGRIYFAKGYSVGAQECIRELVAAEIGTRFGLPIPPFGVASTTDFYNSYNDLPLDFRGLREMPAFVSQKIENCIDYIAANKPYRREKQAEYSRILFFDWWIQNPDRTKGHPNLLEQPATGQVYVIDHNMVLNNDVDDSLEEYVSEHVFGEYADLYTFLPCTYKLELDEIMSSWNEIASLVPDKWLELCSDDNILDSMKDILNRYSDETASFWKAR